ncbi:MAG: uracil phosphoribosyltransferase [Bacteroidetes bacterium]|nr:uracil phosphoribosyltransferase [Bacteroidota bacterium]
MVHILGNHNSVFNQYIAEIRDEIIQKDSLRFRRNIERMGEIMSYELSKSFTYEMREVITSLGIANVSLIKEQPVIASILRAGLPLHQGVLNYFDRAENAFISAYRKHHKNGTFDIQLEYLASPDLNDKVLILCDPMLATGSSIVLTYKALLLRGKPRHTHIVTLIASAEGLAYARKNLPENVTIWCGAVDEELTAKSYIVPGLGDAGDLAYGKKM